MRTKDVYKRQGPGNNIHRTPYGGRNFEYYSEDGFLSGMMSAYEVKAIQDKGVHVVMKHFALNDCEQDRIGLGAVSYTHLQILKYSKYPKYKNHP